MKTYTCKNIRNIALAGHGGSGKTSVAEGLLYKCGEIERMGKVSDGNSVCDYDPEEIKRKISLGTSLAYCQWKDVKINILDTPGQFDFAAGLYEGISAAESVVIALPAKDGVQVGTIKAYREAVNTAKRQCSLSPVWKKKTATSTSVLRNSRRSLVRLYAP